MRNIKLLLLSIMIAFLFVSVIHADTTTPDKPNQKQSVSGTKVVVYDYAKLFSDNDISELKKAISKQGLLLNKLEIVTAEALKDKGDVDGVQELLRILDSERRTMILIFDTSTMDFLCYTSPDIDMYASGVSKLGLDKFVRKGFYAGNYKVTAINAILRVNEGVSTNTDLETVNRIISLSNESNKLLKMQLDDTIKPFNYLIYFLIGCSAILILLGLLLWAKMADLDMDKKQKRNMN